jgi:hypothetical protein
MARSVATVSVRWLECNTDIRTRRVPFVSRCARFIVNAKILVRIPRKTRFLKKAGFPELSGKNFQHRKRFCWRSSARYQLHLTATRYQKKTKLLALAITFR